MNWKTLTKTAKRTLSRNGSKILLGFGIAGAFTAVGFAITATPKAMILLEEKKQELGVEKLDAKTIVKTAAPVYIPTVISMGVSTACIICASSVNDRHNAALAAAYTVAESGLRSYQDKVVEMVGPEKAEEIKEAVALDKMAKCPEPKNPPVATPQKPGIGNDFYNEPIKCWESLSGTYFFTSRNHAGKSHQRREQAASQRFPGHGERLVRLSGHRPQPERRPSGLGHRNDSGDQHLLYIETG